MLWWEEDGIREKDVCILCGGFCLAPWPLNSSVGRTGCRIREKNVFVFFAVPSSASVLQRALCRRGQGDLGGLEK